MKQERKVSICELKGSNHYLFHHCVISLLAVDGFSFFLFILGVFRWVRVGGDHLLGGVI